MAHIATSVLFQVVNRSRTGWKSQSKR